MPDGKKMFLVPHTHWDRAWYLSFEEFRSGLPRLFEEIFRFIDNKANPPFFLDGQTVLLDDYLTARPGMEDRLKEAVAAKRLLVGPFYIQMDEVTAHPEAIVRNIELGLRRASDFGCATKIGYFPDTWGHAAQLPQLLLSFGIDCFVFGRGYKEDVARTGVEFVWKGPDDSRIVSVFMPKGYVNAINLGYAVKWGDVSACVYDEARAIEDLSKECEYLARISPSGNLLVMNGGDHIHPFQGLDALLDKAERLPGISVDRSGFGEYAKRMVAVKDRLQEYRGRLKYGKYSYIVAGTLSSRIYLKQKNNRLSRRAINIAEPLLAYSSLTGAAPDCVLLSRFWRLMLRNLAHDEIGGCGIDSVHREMMCRYEKAEQVLGVLVSSARREIAMGADGARLRDNPFIIFNPSNKALRGLVRIAFLLEEKYAENADFTGEDASGRKMECQVISSKSLFYMEINSARKLVEKEMIIRLNGLEPFAFQSVALSINSGKEGQSRREGDDAPVEFDTGFYRFSAGPGGLSLEDRKTGVSYKNFMSFIDEEDAGDEYTYSPLQNEKGKKYVFTVPGEAAVWRHRGPLYYSCVIRFSFALPEGIDWIQRERSASLVDIPVEIAIGGRVGSSVLEASVTITNAADNHRLRLVMAAGAGKVVRGAHFCFERMEREFLSDTSSWREQPVHTDFFRDYVASESERGGLQIITEDTVEYEALEDGSLCFTLLRCVGDLSREDLMTRKGGAGFSFNTPDAQCHGKFAYDFGVVPFGAGATPDEFYRAADAFLSPPIAFPANDPQGIIPGQIVHPDLPADFEIRPPRHSGVLPDPMRAFAIEPKTIVVSSFKPIEEEDGYILRLVNYSSGETKATVRFFHPLRSVTKTAPCGTPKAEGETLSGGGNVRNLAFGPFGIITLKVLRL